MSQIDPRWIQLDNKTTKYITIDGKNYLAINISDESNIFYNDYINSIDVDLSNLDLTGLDIKTINDIKLVRINGDINLPDITDPDLDKCIVFNIGE